jgi:hypothetical protein
LHNEATVALVRCDPDEMDAVAATTNADVAARWMADYGLLRSAC